MKITDNRSSVPFKIGQTVQAYVNGAVGKVIERNDSGCWIDQGYPVPVVWVEDGFLHAINKPEDIVGLSYE